MKKTFNNKQILWEQELYSNKSRYSRDTINKLLNMFNVNMAEPVYIPIDENRGILIENTLNSKNSSKEVLAGTPALYNGYLITRAELLQPIDFTKNSFPKAKSSSITDLFYSMDLKKIEINNIPKNNKSIMASKYGLDIEDENINVKIFYRPAERTFFSSMFYSYIDYEKVGNRVYLPGDKTTFFEY